LRVLKDPPFRTITDAGRTRLSNFQRLLPAIRPHRLPIPWLLPIGLLDRSAVKPIRSRCEAIPICKGAGSRYSTERNPLETLFGAGQSPLAFPARRRRQLSRGETT